MTTMQQQPATPRVALYARFSTDLQRQTSIADQLVAARDRAAKEGWLIVAEHADEGVSGSVPVTLRRGGKALLADALAARFDILIVEGLDRLSRDMGEQDQVVKRLEYRGLRLIGTSDGYDTLAKGRKVMRVARGLVNELYLDDLRDKTHRGLAGQFGRGLSAGGRSYGYRTEAVDGGRRIVIDEAEAVHVLWIFEQVASGRSPRAVLFELNARGIKSARGGTWAMSGLGGSMARGLGLLQNEIYIGRVIWNRRQWLKDPETGARRYVERPQSEWQVRQAPELRIVADDVWQRVRLARGPGRAYTGGGVPTTLFGGLLRCAECGGSVVAIDARHYGCAAHKDRGPAVCSSKHTWPRKRVDQRLIAEVRNELLGVDVAGELRQRIRAHVAAATRAAEQGDPRRRRAALQGDVERLVDAITRHGYSPSLAGRMQAAEAELQAIDLEAQRARVTSAGATALVDQAIAEYKSLLMQLEVALTEETDRLRTRQILASLLGRVTLGKDAAGESYAELQDPAQRLLVAAGGGADGGGCEGRI